MLERTDELIGHMLGALPAGFDVALVSDHGSERVDHTANVRVLLAQNVVKGEVQPLGGIVTTSDPKTAEFLRHKQAEPGERHRP
jgi:hypothetical protein